MLTDLTTKDFLTKVASNEPVPGGGSIAALCGAVAASLGAMVANLTIGRKKYADVEEEMQKAKDELINASLFFMEAIDRDSDAYKKVFECFKMPKSCDEEISIRDKAIQEATIYAATVPMEVARRACSIMNTITMVAEKGNRNAVTDACVAMMSARNATLAALLNVRINLMSIHDKAIALSMQYEADCLEKTAIESENTLLNRINKELHL